APIQPIRKGTRGPARPRACRESEAHASTPRPQARRAPQSRWDAVFSSREPAGSHDTIVRFLGGMHPKQNYTLLLRAPRLRSTPRSEEHTSELQSRGQIVCRLLLEKKRKPQLLLRKSRSVRQLPN